MNEKRLGRRTIALAHPPSVLSFANVGGKWEGRGPLAPYFDELNDDSFFGEKTWEKAKSTMQRHALQRALDRAGLKPQDLDHILAGESFESVHRFLLRPAGLRHPLLWPVRRLLHHGREPFSGGPAHRRRIRRPGRRRHQLPLLHRRAAVPHACALRQPASPTAQWTATAAGCTILSADGPGPYITHVTCGKIVDLGICDANNMGAAMAPAAYDTLSAFFQDTRTRPEDYDQIFTGDLGRIGSSILQDLLARDGLPLDQRYQDCGLLLYDCQAQDMHAGASGCGCSAAVLNGYVLTQLRKGRWKRVLFAPTGALLSPTSSFQGESIPGICHAVCLCAER